MPGSVENLSDIINEIWDRTNRLFPRRTGTVTLKYIVTRETMMISEIGFTISESIIAQWCLDRLSFNPLYNIYWNNGVWG